MAEEINQDQILVADDQGIAAEPVDDQAKLLNDQGIADEPEEDQPADEDPPVMLRPSYAGVLNWKKKEHLKYYEEGVKPLLKNYAMDAHEKSIFVLTCRLRAQDYEWSTTLGSGILNVLKNGQRVNLLDHYGSISTEQLRAEVTTWAHLLSRATQDDTMLYECIRNTLSKEALLRVFAKRDVFELPNNIGGLHTSGVMFLKVVLDESSLASSATVMKLKTELTQLPELFASHKWNVAKFNEAVEALEQSLTQYGESAPDLLHQLLPAYLDCPEPKFRTYIEQKKNSHEDESVLLTARSLMAFAKSKYSIQKDQGEWNPDAESEAEKSIFALEGRMKKLTKAMGKANKALKKKKTPAKKDKAAKSAKSDKKTDPKSAWKFQAPKGDEPTTIDLNGKTWHWCAIKTGAPSTGGCNMWTRHTPQNCKGYMWKGAVKAAGDKKKALAKKLQAIQAKAAAMEIVEDDSDGYATG